jgi:hypothetical protein
MNRSVLAAAIAGAGFSFLAATPASAHAIAGVRLFPVTLTMDDPGVADEVSIPTFQYSRSGADGGSGPTHEYDFNFEYDKTITRNLSLGVNYGWSVFQTNGAKTQTGFQNLSITAKYQAYVNAAHEFIVSLGVTREFGRTGTSHTGADEYGATSPTIYAGKGLGDLPIGYLRPLAITGELSYTIADKKLKLRQVADPDTGLISTQSNNGTNNAWSGGVSIQYSIPYLQSQVRDFGLPHFIGGLIPLVEITWSSPASTPSTEGTAWTIAPGVIYMGDSYQFGVEALIPANKTAGTTVGFIAQLHLFLDDIFPNSLGKPIFD